MIEIRQADCDDIPYIMNFIEDHWKKGHILAQDEEFFKWQFCPEGKVNMVIARDSESGIVYGMLGYIPYNFSESPDIAGSIWKKIPCGNPILGLDMEAKVYELTRYRWWASPGMNDRAIRLGVLRGDTGAALYHFYRLGYVEDFQIARVAELERREFINYPEVKLVPLNTMEEFSEWFPEEYLRTFMPYKDQRYFQWRYYEHPIYTYDIYGIRLPEGTIRSALICRTVEVKDRKVMRLVDFVGQEEDFEKTGYELDGMLKTGAYEYIDFYMYGLQISTVENAGFIHRVPEDPNIIPNYFEPFVRENVEIKFLLPWGDFRMFRGDGDQDRPSLPRKGGKG